MLVLPQCIKIKWYRTKRKYFESLGYVFTAYGEEFEISADHLPHGSEVYVKVKCDYCLEDYQTEFKVYFKALQGTIKKNACEKCKVKKGQDHNFQVYGTHTTLLVPEVQEKIETTNLNRYGTKCPLSNQEIQEKCKETMIKIYGVHHAAQHPASFEKMKQTNLERYDAEFPYLNEDLKRPRWDSSKRLE
ncbi:hypothetical protein J7E79_24140 [Bacillus sp. ISL-40]|uniref:DUF7487 domain-containing protein n=1 Tax=Bacillus sp. ISL-40 TaxID=2819126 RepID=UPI001BE576D7|nr:hypothetical protein [Bacillus sp. ISL-40]MBT2700431.1 hypothetical protein [Bacillus sp. ISL-40]